MRHMKRLFLLLNIFIPTLSIVLFVSCASTELNHFKKNIKTMPDAELISCYYGIQERLKMIDNNIEAEDHLGPARKRDPLFHQTYLIGGEAHGLMQKEKFVLKEMQKRNLKP